MICDTCKAYECDIDECNCECHKETNYEWSKESTFEEGAAV